MVQFDVLSAELVESIVSFCSNQRDLLSVCLVSKSLYTAAFPFLYRHIDLQIRSIPVPRVDSLFFTILADPKCAKYVKSLRVGPSSDPDVRSGTYFVPPLTATQHEKAIEALCEEPLLKDDFELHDSISASCYGAFVALLVLRLPSLRRLEILDRESPSLGPLHRLFFKLGPHMSSTKISPRTVANFSSLREVYYNVDTYSGTQYVQDARRSDGTPFFFLSNLSKFVSSMRQESRTNLVGRLQHTSSFRSDSLTNLVLRHTCCLPYALENALRSVPKLQQFTCEMSYSLLKTEHDATHLEHWLDLRSWMSMLRLAKRTLQTLVMSLEVYDDTETYYRQPDLTKLFQGYLNLTEFESLHTLEVPVPFITGDPLFSIVTQFEPQFPPNLRHLSLRTDMSRAQYPFRFDPSFRFPEETSLEASVAEANASSGAHMDQSYMFQTTLILLEILPKLESIAIWQPPEKTFCWSNVQLEDVTTTCENKGMVAKVLFPMLLRWKNPEHQDLVKEVTLFDPEYPDRGPFQRLVRGQRDGMEVGLATQYHLEKLKMGHVLGRRR
ncbi:hypothetical protein BCR34DRAFT_558900 [Clohesyomyces aquaticus]|uniref:F-box domain-containing protein n=1 Tax=Clohesyomyces aquaticus TaxID=1231657 RepID=A0A1Y1ZZ62_9PLEO|nr:hypothetical protein BCR34DRAFT_558900 [Clohesyomyces aquaticus]